MSVDRVIQLCTKPPTERGNIDIEIAVSWLRSRSEDFRDIDRDVWREILKSCGYQRAEPDDVIVQQGEIGTCMFIMLTGRASVYIDNFSLDENLTASGSNDITSPGNTGLGTTLDRSVFGKFIIHFEKGRRFVEMALMNEECTRNASIICDQTSDLLVIDKQLFLDHLKGLEGRVYQCKMDFINQNPLFARWPPQVKRLLEMSLRKENYSFNSVVRKQGDHATDVLFVNSGQVKLEADSHAHRRQYPHLLNNTESTRKTKPVSRDGCTLGYLQDHVRLRRLEGYSAAEQRYIHKTEHVCSLSENAIIGDMEVVLGLETFLHTAVSETNTELYVLDRKQFERFISRKNLNNFEKLKIMNWNKLLQRMETKNIPIMRHLKDNLKTLMTQKYLKPSHLVQKEVGMFSRDTGNRINTFQKIKRAQSANPSGVARQHSMFDANAPMVRCNTALSIHKLSGFNLHTYDQMKQLQRSQSFLEFGRQTFDEIDETRPRTSPCVAKGFSSERIETANRVQHISDKELNRTEQKGSTINSFLVRNSEQKTVQNRSLQMHAKSPKTRSSSNNLVSSHNGETKTRIQKDYNIGKDFMFDKDFELSPASCKSTYKCLEIPNETSNTNDPDSFGTLLDNFRKKLEEYDTENLLLSHSPTYSDCEQITKCPISQLSSDDLNIINMGTGSDKMDRLENRVKSFLQRHRGQDGTICHNEAFKLRSIHLQDLRRMPLLGGRVLVTPKPCPQLSALNSSSHKHIRRFLLSKSPGIICMRHL